MGEASSEGQEITSSQNGGAGPSEPIEEQNTSSSTMTSLKSRFLKHLRINLLVS